MPPKRRTRKRPRDQEEILTGAEAIEIQAALHAGEQLDDGMLLALLKADKPCGGNLYSKPCKVGRMETSTGEFKGGNALGCF